MLKTRVVAITLAMSVWPGFSFTQTPQDGPLANTLVNVQPKTSQQYLAEHNIGLDSASLKAALKNTDPMIRGAAAMQLAKDKATDAIPDVEAALAAETDRMNRVRLMSSLALLQPKDDNNIALQSCGNASLGREQVINAARVAIQVDLERAIKECVPNLLAFLKDTNDVRGQIGALETLSSVPYASKLPSATKNEVRATAIEFLRSSDHTKKFVGLQALILDPSKEGRDALAAAAETEQDAGIRRILEDVVKKKDAQLAGKK